MSFFVDRTIDDEKMICYTETMKQIYQNENAVIFDNAFCDFRTGQLLEPIETQNYVIVQVAESYYRSHFHLDTHTQYCDLEITFPVTGCLSCSTRGIWTEIDKHTCYLSFRSDTHALTSPRGCRFQTLAINLKDGPCRPLLEAIRERYMDSHICSMPELASLFSSVIAEFMTADAPFIYSSLDSSITAILVKLARAGMPIPKATLLSAEEKLPAILNFLDSNFLSLGSLEELSVHFGYTYGHICKAFKKTYGVTPGEYLLSKKLEHAASLRREGMKLAQIAEVLGYSSAYNLSRAFKKHYGISPEDFWKSKT